MIMLIDNYDSFSYNLYQLIGSLNKDIQVVRNDAITVDEIKKMHPSHIILSPGPGRPENAGICIEVVNKLQDSIPILGVCLGHQSICEAYGATITYARELMHGKQSVTSLSEDDIFDGLNKEIKVARYHSLAVDRDTIPSQLKIIGETEDEVMAIRHEKHPVYGLQFHPESIMTPEGKKIVSNFLKLKKEA